MPPRDVPVAPTLDDVSRQIQAEIDDRDKKIAAEERKLKEAQSQKTKKTAAISKDITHNASHTEKLNELTKDLETALAEFKTQIDEHQQTIAGLKTEKNALEAQKNGLAGHVEDPDV